MKIALVHDWFNQKHGGGENVALELAKLFPEAPMYTLLFNASKFGHLIEPSRVRTSRLQSLPQWLQSHPRYLLPLIPAAVGGFNFDEFDLVLSSSVAFVKNIKHSDNTYHICYCHSPMRFAWDYGAKYLGEQRIDPLQRWVGRLIRNRIKRWDLKGNKGVNLWIANSQTVADRIERYYHQESEVIYPPVDTSSFSPIAKTAKQDFYITASMLTAYKKLDLVITAFNLSGRKLLVMGEGPDQQRLQKLANHNVKLIGYVDQPRMSQLLSQAKGLIFPSEEDFGIAPVEAMASGTPVIAYGKGGLTETVVPGKTGVLFHEQTAQALNQALEYFEGLEFYPPDLVAQAAKFDRSVFGDRIKLIVKQAGRRHVASE